MAKPNCKCLACQKEYYFCLKCGQSRNVPAWHIDFCDETCKNVFETICSYNCGSLTKEQANEMIGEIDSTKYESLKDSLKIKLKEIQSGSKADSDKKGKAEKGSFIDKKKEQPKEQPKEDKDTSIGLMSPATDAKDEN